MRARRIALIIIGLGFYTALSAFGERIYLWLLLFTAALFVLGAFCAALPLWLLRFRAKVSAAVCSSGDTLELDIGACWFVPLPPPRVLMTLHNASSELEGRSFVLPLDVRPFGRSRQRVAMPCPYRGVWHIGISAVASRDPFGLFEFRTKRDRRESVLVLPAVRELELRPYAGEDGTDPGKGSEDIASIAELRPWRSGDMIKRIHWKQSLKHQKLLVKRFDMLARMSCTVFLDAVEHGQSGKAAAELETRLTVICASVCAYMTAHAYTVTLVTLNSACETVKYSARAEVEALRTRLAKLEFCGEAELGAALKAYAGDGQIICVSPRRSAEALQVLAGRVAAGRRCAMYTLPDTDGAFKRMAGNSGVWLGEI